MPSRTLAYVKRSVGMNRGIYVLRLFCTIILAVIAGTVNVEITRRFADGLLHPNWHVIWAALGLYTVVTVVSVCLRSANAVLTLSSNKELTYALEDAAIDHYTKQQYWNMTLTAEDALGHIRQNTKSVGDEVLGYTFGLVDQGALLIAASAYVITINPLVLAVNTALVGLLMLLSRRRMSKLTQLQEKLSTSANQVYAITWKQIENMEVARFLSQSKVVAAFHRKAEENIQDRLHSLKANSWALSISQLSGTLSILVVAVVGGVLSLTGTIHLADVLALVVIMPTISGVLYAIPTRVADYHRIKGIVVRMDEFFETMTEPPEQGATIHSPIATLEVSRLSYAYLRHQRNTVNQVSFELKAGDFVVVAGPSGCGKSTLLRLCARLLPGDSGAIRWNGIELSTTNRESLWQHIGYLSQTPHITSGTILTNITMERHLPEHEARLAAAIRDSDSAAWIETLSDGVETWIDAESISNGEQQKICIARMFYAGYSAILMDEATAALDPGAEARIVQAMKLRVREQNILFIGISHRRFFMEQADAILLLNQAGEKVDMATHEELLVRSSIYPKLIGEGYVA